jgi:hypothetical protein
VFGLQYSILYDKDEAKMLLKRSFETMDQQEKIETVNGFFPFSHCV